MNSSEDQDNDADARLEEEADISVHEEEHGEEEVGIAAHEEGQEEEDVDNSDHEEEQASGEDSSVSEEGEDAHEDPPGHVPLPPVQAPQQEPPVQAQRRSGRTRQPPDHYGAYVSHRSQPQETSHEEPEWSRKASFLMSMAKDGSFSNMNEHIGKTILNIVSYN